MRNEERAGASGPAQASIPQASKKGLTSSLRSLELARIIVRRDLSSSMLHVEYEIADEMREPIAVLLTCLADSASVLSFDKGISIQSARSPE